jgi:hypothetical protein
MHVAMDDSHTPFDELTELRAVLTTQEIAELTGLRRETISRARPDSRFQRRTEKALRDLYLVVTRMKSVRGEDIGQLAAILRRPQPEFGGRPIAELLREGQVEAVLASLSSEAPPETEETARNPTVDERVAAMIEGDSELRSRLSEIEAVLAEQFGPGARLEREIILGYDEPEGSDELYLRVHNDLSLDENVDRLTEFLHRNKDLLAPVHRHLVVGFL